MPQVGGSGARLQLHLTSPHACRSVSSPSLEPVVSTWDEAGLGSEQDGRGQGCREGSLAAKQRAKEAGEGGMQRERRNRRWVRHQNTALAAGLGLMLGLVLPALTPNILSLAGAHELVRMDR